MFAVREMCGPGDRTHQRKVEPFGEEDRRAFFIGQWKRTGKVPGQHWCLGGMVKRHWWVKNSGETPSRMTFVKKRKRDGKKEHGRPTSACRG